MEKIYENMSEAAPKARREYRDRVDLLRLRLNLLSGKDKLLMTMYLENANSFRQMARLAGVNESSIGRRIHRVTKRLIDGEYITCLRNRNRFTKTEMAIAKDHFLRGLSMKKIAGKRHWSYYRVRKTLIKIKRLVMTMNSD